MADADQVGIITVSEPSKMSNEDLALLVRDGVKKLTALLPYVKELKTRFGALPRGKADIMGCHTWKEFCESVLGRTDSAVRKALANEKEQPKKPKILLRALKQLLPALAVDNPKIRFSVGDDGNVLVSTCRNAPDVPGAKEEVEVEVQLDVKGPTTIGGMPFRYDDLPFQTVLMPMLDRPNESGDLPKGKPFEVKILGPTYPQSTVVLLPPFDFKVNPYYVIDAIKPMEGDPTIIFSGPSARVRVVEGDGQLRFVYEPDASVMNTALAAVFPDRFPQQPPEPTQPTKAPVPDPIAAEARQQRIAAQAEEHRKKQVLLESAKSLMVRIPAEVSRFVTDHNAAAGRVRITLDVTLEQLEKIVDALCL